LAILFPAKEAQADGDGRQPLGRAFVGRPVDAP